jgi:hypothetical protein
VIEVRCHGRTVAVVEEAPGGFPDYKATNRRIPREHRLWDGRNTTFVNLAETTRTDVVARCRTCGEIRIPVVLLLEAWRNRQSLVLT